MNSIKCKICNYQLSKKVMTFDKPDEVEIAAKVDAKHYERNYYLCDNCGVFQSDLAYHLIDNSQYNKNYYEHADPEKIGHKFNRVMSLTREQSDNWQRVERILENVNKYRKNLNLCRGTSLLDIGAGTGVFIAKFLKLTENWTCTALEPDVSACEHLRKNLQADVIEDVLSPELKTIKYDLVTFNRVLEHFPEPLDMIKIVPSLLKPEGIVYLELPDTNSLYCYGKENEAFGSAHLTIFDLKTLLILFENAGLFPLQVGRFKEPSGKLTVFGFATCKSPI